MTQEIAPHQRAEDFAEFRVGKIFAIEVERNDSKRFHLAEEIVSAAVGEGAERNMIGIHRQTVSRRLRNP